MVKLFSLQTPIGSFTVLQDFEIEESLLSIIDCWSTEIFGERGKENSKVLMDVCELTCSETNTKKNKIIKKERKKERTRK